jgi:hypothetical protein
MEADILCPRAGRHRVVPVTRLRVIWHASFNRLLKLPACNEFARLLIPTILRRASSPLLASAYFREAM